MNTSASATQLSETPAKQAEMTMKGVTEYPSPPFRVLRGFALDPSLCARLETAEISTVQFRIPWEKLKPGPVGEYLEVIDYDPPSKCFYDPVDLDDPRLLAQSGLAPSEGSPQFHQQMVYAVASLTIHNFEKALGRLALWSPRRDPDNPQNLRYVQRLRVYPHALREANAYYSPMKKALLFGHYNASDDDPGDHIPGGTVFTCLSQDIVAHETTHALLDGMHHSYARATDLDVRAFHEAFADVVALLQHFTFPELVRHQVAQTQGDLGGRENLLGQLASEFGRTTGMRTALRDAIGRLNPETKKWEPHKPKPTDYKEAIEPHARGAVLVAAIFDAFLSIYSTRTADLVRLATSGTGILPQGALHPDLVNRLSQEVSITANQVMSMCIRALDYCPPVDLTFGEYLRALITADWDLVQDDDLHYRVAFIEAFKRRGIYPPGVRVMSEESLVWRGPQEDDRPVSKSLINGMAPLREFAEKQLYSTSREQVFEIEKDARAKIESWLRDHLENSPDGPADGKYLGIEVARNQRTEFDVRSARVANRIGPDGNLLPQVVIGLVQKKKMPGVDTPLEGGCTIIADLRSLKIRYCIRKNVLSTSRAERQERFQAASRGPSLRETYFGHLQADEPFALMHRGRS